MHNRYKATLTSDGNIEMVQENIQHKKKGEVFIISEEFLDSEIYELLNIDNPNKKQKTSNVSNEDNEDKQKTSNVSDEGNEDTDNSSVDSVGDSSSSFVSFPEGPCKKRRTTTFDTAQLLEIQELARIGNQIKIFIKQGSETMPYLNRALKHFIQNDVDRPELLEIANKATIKLKDDEDQATTYNFQIHYRPSTSYVFKGDDTAKNLIKSTFNQPEHKTINKVFADESTQALSLNYITERGSQLIWGCVSTIIFKLVNETKSTEPFIFVYYRTTNKTPLCKRAKKDSYYKKCKFNMDNLGIGHLLLRIAQQLLCENDKNRRSYRIYLVANDDLVSGHYKKIGFEQIAIDGDEMLNTDMPPELKEYLELENTRNTTLKLVVCGKPLNRDKICFRRKLEKILSIKEVMLVLS